MIPTYNERESIEPVIRQILALPIPDLFVVVADDASPDGTGDVVRQLEKEDPRVHLLHRPKRHGRGLAGLDGFSRCLALDADVIIEMDGDGSHDPSFIPRLIEPLDSGADLVLGSRLVPKGSDPERGWIRRAITRMAAAYARTLLRLPARDVTSGFRAFHRRVLEAVDPENCISAGPPVVLEVLFKAVRRGFTVAEVPIRFGERKAGSTKLNWVTLLDSFVTVLKFRSLAAQGRAGW